MGLLRYPLAKRISLHTAENANRLNWHVDAVVNVDSFPEMPKKVAREYISKARHAIYLLSINQESGIKNGNDTQGIVKDPIMDFSFNLVSRYPSWMRTGYIEELYLAQSPTFILRTLKTMRRYFNVC